MAVVAEKIKTNGAGAVASRPRPTRRARVRRRPASRIRRYATLVFSALVLACLFGYVSVYASLAKEGYSRSDLVRIQREETLENQRLKVELDSLCSPHKVVARAEESGMVYATQYDYVAEPETLASLPNSAVK